MLSNEPHSESPAEKDTGRLEAFSDGVFSIALTLLVLELKVPSLGPSATGRALGAALLHQWPGYFAFVTSFFTVLIMWVNHHAIFKLIRRSDATLLFTNGFLLLLVTAVPFPTAVVAAYLMSPAAWVACLLYSGTFVVISVTFGLLLLAVARKPHLMVPHGMPEVRRRIRDCYLVGVPAYAVAAATAPFFPVVSMLICTALWVFWSVER